MEKTGKVQHRFGLIGKNIAYSFSRAYFSKKFERLKLEDHSYENFDLNSIEEFPEIIDNESLLRGLNVTIPYKEVVIPFLDRLDPKAEEIGAVNTIEFREGKLIGHNTDIYGFEMALAPLLIPADKHALILGTGGASKAVAYVLAKLGLEFKLVSRKPKEGQLKYDDLNEDLINKYTVVINTSPLGTYPDTDKKPDIPYSFVTSDHLLFDLIYNPEKTAFMKEGIALGARVSNGQKMLELQAEKAWEIWNS